MYKPHYGPTNAGGLFSVINRPLASKNRLMTTMRPPSWDMKAAMFRRRRPIRTASHDIDLTSRVPIASGRLRPRSSAPSISLVGRMPFPNFKSVDASDPLLAHYERPAAPTAGLAPGVHAGRPCRASRPTRARASARRIDVVAASRPGAAWRSSRGSARRSRRPVGCHQRPRRSPRRLGPPRALARCGAASATS